MRFTVRTLRAVPLAYAVALQEGFREVTFLCGYHEPAKGHVPTQVMVSEKKDSSYLYLPDSDILYREHISTVFNDHLGRWDSYGGVVSRKAPFRSRNPLVAGLRCYLFNKVGEFINLPEELASC